MEKKDIKKEVEEVNQELLYKARWKISVINEIFESMIQKEMEDLPLGGQTICNEIMETLLEAQERLSNIET